MKISCKFEISFRSKWLIWNPYRCEFHFASIHANISKELTEHRSEIFNRNEISFRFNFISSLMWTYSASANYGGPFIPNSQSRRTTSKFFITTIDTSFQRRLFRKIWWQGWGPPKMLTLEETAWARGCLVLACDLVNTGINEIFS